MKLIRATFVVSALAVLGGCVAVPVDPGYYGGAPAYYAPPVFYAPSIGIGVYGGSRGHGRGHGRSHGRGYGYR